MGRRIALGVLIFALTYGALLLGWTLWGAAFSRSACGLINAVTYSPTHGRFAHPRHTQRTKH